MKVSSPNRYNPVPLLLFDLMKTYLCIDFRNMSMPLKLIMDWRPYQMRRELNQSLDLS